VNIFGIGLPEMIVILVVALLVFGPKKLPEIGKSLGKAIRGLQDGLQSATKDFENALQEETKQIEPSLVEPPVVAKVETEAEKMINITPVEETKVNSASVDQ
jgi:sec-independent protein translocase protein TatA